MSKQVYRYDFSTRMPIDDVEASLVLALFATESLYGEEQTRLEASQFFDRAKRACVIDASTDVGRDLNRLFVGFIRREFGADSFQVRLANRPVASAAA